MVIKGMNFSEQIKEIMNLFYGKRKWAAKKPRHCVI